MGSEEIKDDGIQGAEKDDFDGAFDEAAAKEETEQAKGIGRDGPPSEKAEAEEVKEEKGKVEEKKPEQPSGKKEEQQAPELQKLQQTLEDLQHKYETLQGMYNSVVKKEAPPEKKDEPAPKTEPEATVKVDDFFKGIYDDLDDIAKETLKEYEDEFDVPSKAEDIKRNHALKKTVALLQNYVKGSLTQFSKELQKVIDPIVEANKKADDESHFSSIAKAHPDYETYRDNGELMAWIDDQPTVIKKEWKRVYKEGSTKEAIELLDVFKASKGISKDKKEQARKNKDEDNVRDLEMVKGKSSGVNIDSSEVPEDFDSAWDEAIQKSNRSRR